MVDGLDADNPRQRDAFTAAYWNGRVGVVIHPAPSPAVADVRQRAQALFGRGTDDTTWGRLVGAPDGATVEVLPSPEIGYRDGVQLKVHHPWLDGPAIRYVFVNADGKLAMLNDQLFVRPDAPKGIGTRVLAHQVREAQALGISDIVAEAAGAPGGTMNGYYTWARLGFDGLIPQQVRNRLPIRWRSAAYVLDVIEQPGGADWWRANGRSYWGTFDLRQRSRSMRVLQGYTDEKGIII